MNRNHLSAYSLLATVLAAIMAQQSRAAVIDGSIVGDNYGTPLAVQTVQTQFGDSNGSDKGSELNAAYARIDSGELVLALTGNLEDNFNKLVIFFDSQPGGQNALDTDTANGGSNPVMDPSPFPSDPGLFAKMNSFNGPSTFDSGFFADYLLVVRHGFTGSENRMDVDYGVLGGSSSQHLGVLDPTMDVSGMTGVGANASPIQVGFDNSNVAGIGGGVGPANQTAATLVTTGIELAIDLADLGSPNVGDEIKVMAFITNSNHDFVSNQFLGGLPAGTDNLGSDGFGSFFPNETFFDLNDFAGDQFFTVTVVPEPSTTSLAVCMGAVLCWRRSLR